ncbi:MAG: hypothetical protein OEY59_01760 [Deltaproteobacteria bacterium]|nr:hypothetical protein [Deltaproteobacteria bacterium]
MRRIEINYLFILSLILFLSLYSGARLFAQDATSETSSQQESQADEDDFLEGFEDTGGGFEDIKGDIELNIEKIQAESSGDGKSLFSLNGFVKEELNYSFAQEEPDFSKIRTTLNLKMNFRTFDAWKLVFNLNSFYDASYSKRGRDNFTPETLETYENETEIRDFYFEGPISDWLRIKSGNQVIAWGQSDVGQIIDMANPRDLRELGMVDLEDARLPVVATKFTSSVSSIELNLVAIHQIKPNKVATKGSEFDPLAGLRSQADILDEEVPVSGNENTEYLFRYLQHFNGGDFSFVWADVFDDAFYLDFYRLDLSGTMPKVSLVPRHKRIKSVGVGGNLVSGSFLFKGELAQIAGKNFMRNDQFAQIMALKLNPQNQQTVFNEDSRAVSTVSEKTLAKLMLGVEYSGITDVTVSFEGLYDQILDYEDNLMDNESNLMFSMMVSLAAMNDLFHSRLFFVHFSDDNGNALRLNVDYNVMDALNVEGGIMLYIEGKEDGFVYPVKDSDRLIASIKYSF